MPQSLCNQCPRRCGAVRSDSENVGGYCGMPALPKIARADLHFWEEPCISGQNGSGTIFFSGCSLSCVYCQNYDISHKNEGRVVTVEELANIMRDLEAKGAHNINFVNPTHYFSVIKEALSIYRPKIPLVYNSSGYDLSENIAEDIFDIYLFDLKYVSDDIALKYSGAADYVAHAASAIKTAYRLKKNTFDKNGIMKSGVIVRHLVLPMNTRAALSAVDWFCENTHDATLSIMSQYTPCGEASRFKELTRRITPREYDKVLNYIYEKGIENVYVQDLNSSVSSYIPDFNMK